MQGDCLDRLKELPDNFVDCVVTDPPYGLKFMGKKWDYSVPSVEIWKSILRVLKPGGHVLSFGGTRTYHRMVVAIEEAGFEIRDQIQWLYGSGFPKSHNLKGDHEGWGSALKPANEPIVLARKPLEKGLTVAENVLKWGCGGLNIDGTRIPAQDLDALQKNWDRTQSKTMENEREAYGKFGAIDLRDRAPQGRWPANVIFDEAAAEMLDEQSGQLKSGNLLPGHKQTGHGDKYSFRKDAVIKKPYGGDSGGASRFFYVAKASKRERNAGLDKNALLWESDAWEKQDLNSLMENISQLVRATSDDISTDEFSWSTELFGLKPAEKFPKGLIFTISTASKLIIDLRISSASQSLNTRESIQDAIKMIEANGLSLVESAAIISQLRPNITREKTASHLGAVHALLLTLSKIKGFAKTGNFHSTVKPIKLMEYLITLICPPAGIVLDPFMGSGSTGVAAQNLECGFIGIELNQEYVEIAEKRIEAVS